MRGHIDDGVHVGLMGQVNSCQREFNEYTHEGYASEVPENDEETPFLVEHVPSLGDTFFAFAACIEIKPGGKAHERHVLRRS